MKRLLPLLFALLAACSMPPVERLPVPFTTLAMGEQSRIRQAETVVVRDGKQWAALWQRHADGAERPAVDFGRDMVIAVFLGQRPSGGYGVRIRDVREEPERITVHVQRVIPEPGSAVTQVITHPFVMIRLPRRDKPVTFAEEP